MNVTLFGAGRLGTRGRRLVERSVRLALGPRGRRRGELCVIFVGDRRIRSVNKRYLGHDYATDVIAFPYPAPPKGARGEAAPFGDIFISWDTARRQARELGHSLLREVLTLAAHGALHLVGYDDHRPADRRRMFARQDAVVRRLLP